MVGVQCGLADLHKRKKFGKLKLLPGYTTLHRMEVVKSAVGYWVTYILRSCSRGTSMWVTAAEVAMRLRVLSYHCMLAMCGKNRSGANTIYFICVSLYRLVNAVSIGVCVLERKREMRLNLLRKYR